MTPLDDQILDELVARAQRNQPADAEQLGALVEELRAHRIQTSAEQRLRSNHSALVELVRSDALASGDLDQALREITETAAEVLCVARVSVWRLDEAGDNLRCVELHRADAGVHEPGSRLARVELPSYFEALLAGELIVARDASADPRTAELASTYLEPLGVRSVLEAPVAVDGRVDGSIRAEPLASSRSWSTLDGHFAGTLADFTALAIDSYRRKQTEERLRETLEIAEQRLRTIEDQRQAIAVLSAPIIDVWQGILAVPIVGHIDAEHSIELTERLLQRIVESGAHSVIVDLTGIEMVDTMTASHLLQMLRSARLLGTRCVLGGISPQIALTMVKLDVDLSEFTLVRNLEQALVACLRHPTPSRSGGASST